MTGHPFFEPSNIDTQTLSPKRKKRMTLCLKTARNSGGDAAYIASEEIAFHDGDEGDDSLRAIYAQTPEWISSADNIRAYRPSTPLQITVVPQKQVFWEEELRDDHVQRREWLVDDQSASTTGERYVSTNMDRNHNARHGWSAFVLAVTRLAARIRMASQTIASSIRGRKANRINKCGALFEMDFAAAAAESFVLYYLSSV